MFVKMEGKEPCLITSIDWRPRYDDTGECIEREVWIVVDEPVNYGEKRYKIEWFNNSYIDEEIHVDIMAHNGKMVPAKMSTAIAEAIIEYTRELNSQRWNGLATGDPEWLVGWYTERRERLGDTNVFCFNRTNAKQYQDITYEVDLFEELINS